MARIKPYAILPWIIQRGVWLPFRVFFLFFIKLRIYGLHNLKILNNKKIIFVSNHTSELDPVLIPSSFPFFSNLLPVFNVSREKKFYSDTMIGKLLFGGLFFKILGSYPAIVGLNNYSDSLSVHKKILDENNTLVIFPEGRISKTGKVENFKNGVGYLVVETGSMVVPVRIYGLYNLSLKDLILRKRSAVIKFGTPIDFKELNYFNEKNNLFLYEKVTNVILNKILEL